MLAILLNVVVQSSFLLSVMQEHVLKIKQEGNDCFKAQKYDDALGKYVLALQLCQTYSITDETALIRSNCAQACLNLGWYRDAYDHADECVRLNPNLDKVTCCCVVVVTSMKLKQ